MMKYFFGANFFAAVFLVALANSLVKLAKSDNWAKTAQCNNVNYNFYAGPNTMKIEQQLGKIREEIKALKENKSDVSGSSLSGVLCSEVKQQLAEIKQELRALKENQTGCSGSSVLFSEVKQQLTEIKQEIRALKGNQTGVLKGNQTVCSGGKVSVYKNCADVYKSGSEVSGVYKIDPDGLGEFEVFCDQKTAGGGWTVFQKRKNGSVDFFRTWDDYKRGFGNLKGDFWLGLDKIHRLTVSSRNTLRVDLVDPRGRTAFAEYSSFAVAKEAAKYQLSLGNFSGTAGDSLGNHRGMAFTTKDRDNDKWSKDNYALRYKGAWWYNYCYFANLNGLYLLGKSNDLSQGMVWQRWAYNTNVSLKRSEMKIRAKGFQNSNL